MLDAKAANPSVQYLGAVPLVAPLGEQGIPARKLSLMLDKAGISKPC